MAEIQQKKEEDLKKLDLSQLQLDANQPTEQVNLELQKCMDKVAEFQRRLALKQCYSRQPMYFKRHLINQQKLNNFLERSTFEDWSVYSLSRQNSILERLSSVASMNSDELEISGIGTITFKVLLDRLEQAEKNYEQLHAALKQDQEKKPKKGLRAFQAAANLLSHRRQDSVVSKQSSLHR
jgi:hypothetical protein